MFQQTSGGPSGITIYLRVPEHICIWAKKMNKRLPRTNSLGMGNMSKQLGSLLVLRNPNISQHAHMIRTIVVDVPTVASVSITATKTLSGPRTV